MRPVMDTSSALKENLALKNNLAATFMTLPLIKQTT